LTARRQVGEYSERTANGDNLCKSLTVLARRRVFAALQTVIA